MFQYFSPIILRGFRYRPILRRPRLPFPPLMLQTTNSLGGLGNDIINLGTMSSAGPTGPTGPACLTCPTGPTGPSGGGECSTHLITESYTATLDDCYIGADLTEDATLTLPLDPPDGTQIIIKLQYGAPVGTRKLTINAAGTNLIDSVSSIVLTTPYQSLTLISQGSNWYLI